VVGGEDERCVRGGFIREMRVGFAGSFGGGKSRLGVRTEGADEIASSTRTSQKLFLK